MNWSRFGDWVSFNAEDVSCVIQDNTVIPEGIGEPVIAVVKSFKEKGRWKIESDLYSQERTAVYSWKNYHIYTITDTKTRESYEIKSSYSVYYNHTRVFPSNLNAHSLPTWMSNEEKQYVKETFDKISEEIQCRVTVVEDRKRSKSEKLAKVNQDKERQRLINLYCKE